MEKLQFYHGFCVHNGFPISNPAHNDAIGTIYGLGLIVLPFTATNGHHFVTEILEFSKFVFCHPNTKRFDGLEFCFRFKN